MTDRELSSLSMLRFEAIGPRKAWSVGTARRGMERYNATLRKVARDRSLVLIDLEKAVPKTLEYFEDDVHYRDKAFDVIASHVAGGLRDHAAALFR
jgi:hypothetical protein